LAATRSGVEMVRIHAGATALLPQPAAPYPVYSSTTRPLARIRNISRFLARRAFSPVGQRSWTTTVQALRATMAAYYIRLRCRAMSFLFL